MISKELLSAVLGVEVTNVIGIMYVNELRFETFDDEINPFNFIRLNDLFVKCKQWALKNIIDKDIQSNGCIISSWTDPNGEGRARILVIDETFIADTEVEAVIKACEWILKNDKPRLL